MGKRFRKKHIVKAFTVALYVLMVASMVVGWSMQSYR